MSMKDPYKRRRTKIRLLVSFNGVFQRRQPSGKLRYTGGETRILSVDRTITLSSLKSQVLDLVVQSCNNGCTTFFLFLKYQLQDCCESERSDLFPINNDDDVACMIDQFEKLEFDGKLTRLWVFACNNSEGSCGDITSRKAHHVSTKNEKGNVKKLSDDYSLRKMVLKQQLLAKQYSKNGVDLCNNMLDYEYNKNGDFGGNNEGFLELIPLSKSRPLNSKDNNLRLGVNCEVTKGSLDKSDCSGVGSELKSPESRIDAKLEAAASVDSTQLSIMNRENIVPWRMDFNVPRNGVALLSRNNQLVASACTLMQVTREVFGGPCCRLHNHRVGLSESRNARNYLYQIRNRGSGYEMGKHHNFRLNGKSAIGKNYPGIRSGSSILKRGQTVRSYDFASLKDSYGHRCPTVKEVTEVNKLSPNNNSCGVEELVDKSGKGLPQHGEGDSTECRLDYGFRNIIKSNGSPLPISSGTMAINSQKDLLSCPDYGKLEAQCQALSKDVADRSTSCKPLSDISKNRRLLDQQEVNKIISSEDNLKWRCDSMTFSSYQNSANSSQHSISSAVDLSLHDLYLSRSSKLELESSPQSQDFEAMDEEHLSLGNPIEKSSGAVSCLLLDGDFRKKNYNNSEEDMQHSTQTNPSICEQVENGKENKCSNVNAVPDDILACYPCAAKTGLQTIKNNALEYIKELGSGTYGTVFYGKWKGSDVAIKRLKPSCFTEGIVEEDRLVTDFWKEAHTLGQLHHPNIVALYGVVTDGPANNLATVTEYMVNGSLKQVFRRKDRTIDRRKRLIIVMDAAFGMEYLHEKNIVHFDLKSHNFLVNMRDPLRPVCKIGDLGLSKIKQRTLVSGGVRGTIPWMAPELLNGENMVTEKVDVYSFGIVMWELLTGEEPYSKMRAEEVIVGIIRGNLRPEVPRWCDPGWRSLMERCWSADPKARPAFSDIAKELRAMAAAMNIK